MKSSRPVCSLNTLVIANVLLSAAIGITVTAPISILKACLIAVIMEIGLSIACYMMRGARKQCDQWCERFMVPSFPELCDTEKYYRSRTMAFLIATSVLISISFARFGEIVWWNRRSDFV